VCWVPVYVLLGVGVWLATYQSGIHATIAGVALGLLTPAQAQAHDLLEEMALTEQVTQATPEPPTVKSVSARARASISVVERFEHVLHPWTSYAIVPIFALANAGITLGGDVIVAAMGSPITLGVVIGLVGKLSGVFGSAWLAHRLGFATFPEGGGVASHWGSRRGGRHWFHGVRYSSHRSRSPIQTWSPKPRLGYLPHRS
jgi:Na+:H+ antiporter, NhaA family